MNKNPTTGPITDWPLRTTASRRDSAAQQTTNRRRGATLIEFALTAPILIFLLLGIVEFGWLVRNTNIIGNAAREGARAAAVGYTPDRIYERAVEGGSPLLLTDAEGNITNGDVVMQYSPDGKTFGEFPGYQEFPPGSCPVDWRPGNESSETVQAHARRASAQKASKRSDNRVPRPNSRAVTPVGDAPVAHLIPATSPELDIVLVKSKKPTPVPTAAPTPTPTQTPPPNAPTPTPEPTPLPTIPPPGATPTPIPGSGSSGVACQNSVKWGETVRVTVTYEHQTLTGFFPFLRNRIISVTQVMIRDNVLIT